MIQNKTMTAFAVGVLTSIAVSIVFTPSITHYESQPEPEPSILEPLIDEGISTSTEAAEDPDPVPEGAICTSDCPLIVAYDIGPDEEAIREYFSDVPAMIEVAFCESRFRQFEPDGSGALKNRQGSSARGAFQIMDSWHREDALAVGYDTHTLEGNLGYARQLFESQGLRPWYASRDCWEPRLKYARGSNEAYI